MLREIKKRDEKAYMSEKQQAKQLPSDEEYQSSDETDDEEFSNIDSNDSFIESEYEESPRDNEENTPWSKLFKLVYLSKLITSLILFLCLKEGKRVYHFINK